MSTAVNPTPTSVPASSRPSSIPANHSHTDSPYGNGHHHHHHDVGSHQQPGAANAAKKSKQKKATDPNEASKLIAAKISQLELGAAEDKEQEAEIGWCFPFRHPMRLIFRGHGLALGTLRRHLSRRKLDVWRRDQQYLLTTAHSTSQIQIVVLFLGCVFHGL